MFQFRKTKRNRNADTTVYEKKVHICRQYLINFPTNQCEVNGKHRICTAPIIGIDPNKLYVRTMRRGEECIHFHNVSFSSNFMMLYLRDFTPYVEV